MTRALELYQLYTSLCTTENNNNCSDLTWSCCCCCCFWPQEQVLKYFSLPFYIHTVECSAVAAIPTTTYYHYYHTTQPIDRPSENYCRFPLFCMFRPRRPQSTIQEDDDGGELSVWSCGKLHYLLHHTHFTRFTIYQSRSERIVIVVFAMNCSLHPTDRLLLLPNPGGET